MRHKTTGSQRDWIDLLLTALDKSLTQMWQNLSPVVGPYLIMAQIKCTRRKHKKYYKNCRVFVA